MLRSSSLPRVFVDYYYVGMRAGSEVTIPLLVREMLKIEEGDYGRLSISRVVKDAATARGESTWKEVAGRVSFMGFSQGMRFWLMG